MPRTGPVSETLAPATLRDRIFARGLRIVPVPATGLVTGSRRAGRRPATGKGRKREMPATGNRLKRVMLAETNNKRAKAAEGNHKRADPVVRGRRVELAVVEARLPMPSEAAAATLQERAEVATSQEEAVTSEAAAALEEEVAASGVRAVAVSAAVAVAAGADRTLNSSETSL